MEIELLKISSSNSNLRDQNYVQMPYPCSLLFFLRKKVFYCRLWLGNWKFEPYVAGVGNLNRKCRLSGGLEKERSARSRVLKFGKWAESPDLNLFCRFDNLFKRNLSKRYRFWIFFGFAKYFWSVPFRLSYLSHCYQKVNETWFPRSWVSTSVFATTVSSVMNKDLIRIHSFVFHKD